MAVKDRIQVRIDHDTKALAEEKLKAQGLTISEYTRMMLANAAYGNLQIKIEKPNSQLESSIEETTDFIAGKKHLDGYTDADSLNKRLMD